MPENPDVNNPLGFGKFPDTPIYDLPEAYIASMLVHLLKDIATNLRRAAALRDQLLTIDAAYRETAQRWAREAGL